MPGCSAVDQLQSQKGASLAICRYTRITVLPFIVLTAVAVVALLVAEVKALTSLRWLAKPVASMGFVATAVAGGAGDSLYGRWVLSALMLGLVGDVLMIPRSRNSFLAGLVAFLFAHLAITLAFALFGIAGTRFGLAAVVMLAASALADRWLSPHLEGATLAAVRAYIIGISVMVATAAGSRHGHHWLTLTGAALFYISDLAVAREQFVAKSPLNRMWGLPVYYAGQLLIAIGASTPDAYALLFGL